MKVDIDAKHGLTGPFCMLGAEEETFFRRFRYCETCHYDFETFEVSGRLLSRLVAIRRAIKSAAEADKLKSLVDAVDNPKILASE